MRLIFLLIAIFISSSVFAQNDWRLYSNEDSINQKYTSEDSSYQVSDTEGNVLIISDQRIDTLVAYLDDNPPLINGYRVQIYFGKRSKAEQKKATFLKKYSDWPIYIVWQQPDFKVQVGNFMTKIQAEKVQHEIISAYPNAYPIYTKIVFSE